MYITIEDMQRTYGVEDQLTALEKACVSTAYVDQWSSCVEKVLPQREIDDGSNAGSHEMRLCMIIGTHDWSMGGIDCAPSDPADDV